MKVGEERVAVREAGHLTKCGLHGRDQLIAHGPLKVGLGAIPSLWVHGNWLGSVVGLGLGYHSQA